MSGRQDTPRVRHMEIHPHRLLRLSPKPQPFMTAEPRRFLFIPLTPALTLESNLFHYIPKFLRFPLLSIPMAKKRKSVATRLDEVDRTMYSTFCSAANSLSQLYTQAMNQQKLSFQAGERHALVWSLFPFSFILCLFVASFFHES